VLVWRNDDIVPHSATAADSSWDSGTLQSGESWRMVAAAPGSWSYICTLRPSMKGKLVIR
jgi:plastocyanin